MLILIPFAEGVYRVNQGTPVFMIAEQSTSRKAQGTEVCVSTLLFLVHVLQWLPVIFCLESPPTSTILRSD